MLKTDKLEEILIKNWTHFIDARELMNLALSFAKKAGFSAADTNRVEMVTFSRFQLQESDFLVWLEYKIGSERYTSEALISKTGIFHQRTIKLNS